MSRYAAHAAAALLPLALTALAPMAQADSPAPSPGMHTDIEYGKADGESLKLDASVPSGEGSFPVVILVHGGGWGSGDKEGDMAPILGPLLTPGFTWFTINYRMAPAHRWPACQEDVVTALRWIKKHAAEYKGDPKRVALIGYSAGGQLATLAAVQARRGDVVQAVVGLAAPTDMEADTARRGGLSKSLQDLFGRTTTAVDPEALKWMQEMSTIRHLRRGLPPFLLVHGTADKSVPYSQSINLQAKLKELGTPCDLITLPEAPHAIAKWATSDATYPAAIVAWLTKTLGSATTSPVSESGAITR